MAKWLFRILALGFVIVGLGGLIVPTGVLLASSWQPWSPAPDHTGWAIFGQPGVQRIASDTLLLATLVTIAACAIAALLVWLMRRSHASVSVVGLPPLLMPLLADQLARNYGWYFLLRADGIVNRLLRAFGWIHEPARLLYKLETVAVAMIQGLFPLATVSLLLSVAFLDPGVTVVARSLGSGRAHTATRITGPLLLPGLMLGVCFVFSTAFGYFITPKMLGGDRGMTVAALIDQRINLLLDWPGGSALATGLAIAALLSVGLFYFAFRRLEPVSGFASVPLPDAPAPRRLATVSFWALLCLLVATPLVPVAGASLTAADHLSFPPVGFSGRWYAHALFSPAWASAWHVSLVLATAAAAVACVLAVGALFLTYARPRLRAPILIALALPLLVPPIALAVGLYRTFAALGLSDPWLRLLLGHTVRALPFPGFALLLSAQALDPNLVQAARVYGAGQLRSWLQALGPHYGPGLAAGFLLGWLVSFSDLECALFLGGPETTTLPMQVFSGLHYAVDPTIAACATLTTTIGAALLVTAARIGARFPRLAGRRSAQALES